MGQQKKSLAQARDFFVYAHLGEKFMLSAYRRAGDSSRSKPGIISPKFSEDFQGKQGIFLFQPNK